MNIKSPTSSDNKINTIERTNLYIPSVQKYGFNYIKEI